MFPDHAESCLALLQASPSVHPDMKTLFGFRFSRVRIRHFGSQRRKNASKKCLNTQLLLWISEDSEVRSTSVLRAGVRDIRVEGLKQLRFGTNRCECSFSYSYTHQHEAVPAIRQLACQLGLVGLAASVSLLLVAPWASRCSLLGVYSRYMRLLTLRKKMP